jgi:hypothetical protein
MMKSSEGGAGPFSTAQREGRRGWKEWNRIRVVVVVLLVAAVVSGSLGTAVLLNGNSSLFGGHSSGGGNGGPPGNKGLSLTTEGSFVYQPSETNYSSKASSGSAYGVLTAANGTHYNVLLGGTFSASTPIAIQASFGLKADTSLSGFYDIASLKVNSPASTPSPNTEVNLSMNSLGVAAANLTFGVSTNPSTPYAYLAFGTYPTFFSNVTMQGVALNVSVISGILNVNMNWLVALAHGIDPNIPTAFDYVIVVNQTISLPDTNQLSGQAQIIITPQNVSAFISAISSSQGSASSSMITTALNKLDEEFVAVCTVSPGKVTYSFLLAPIELTRTSLAGILSLDVEESYLGVSLVTGYNSNITAAGSPVHAFVGVTWDQSPVSASGYVSSTVPGLWSVATEKAVTLQAPAVGISLYDAGNSLQSMGYSEGQYLMDLATLQNPAVFVMVDPSLVQNPNETMAYSSYAVAIVPNDELTLQTSVSLYLTLNGVVYNTSYYLGTCSRTNLPACPLFVADTIGYGHPPQYLPYQLGNLSSPTFVQTTGFLTGTTMKNVGQYMGDYDIFQNSPIDIGVYDLGYSDGQVGWNLPAIYITWGTGPTLKVTNNFTQGLYIPTSNDEAAWYLSTYGDYLPGSGMAIQTISALQSYVGAVRQFVYGSVLNGSRPVPGVLLMMDLWTNASAGQVLADADSVKAVSSGCLDKVSNCIVAQVSLSADSGAFLNPPASAGLLVNMSGPSTVSDGLTINCVDLGTTVASACQPPNPPPTPGFVGCLTGGLCAFTPYHVVNLTSTFCYHVKGSMRLNLCPVPPWVNQNNLFSAGSYSVSFALFWQFVVGGTSVPIATTATFSVTLS